MLLPSWSESYDSLSELLEDISEIVKIRKIEQQLKENRGCWIVNEIESALILLRPKGQDKPFMLYVWNQPNMKTELTNIVSFPVI